MRTLLLILSFSLVASLALAEGKIRGNYDTVGTVPQKNSMEKVVFEEFLNFGCPHCNNFRNLSREMKEKYKGRVEFIDIPILFPRQGDWPLRLYYVGKMEGKEEQVKDAIFDAKFKHGVDIFDKGIVNYLARSLGMGDVYREKGNNPEIDVAIKYGEEKARQYGVRSTPTVVMAGALKMNIGSSMEQFVDALPNTLDDLLKN